MAISAANLPFCYYEKVSHYYRRNSVFNHGYAILCFPPWLHHQRKGTNRNGLDVNNPAVIFVCLGNICRSPLARALFSHHAQSAGKAGFECDSAGTSNTHAGEPADPRTVRNARENGLIFQHRARQVCTDDFYRFDYMLAMDRQNLGSLMAQKTLDSNTRIHLLREWDTNAPGADVPDPLYGDAQGFEQVFQILDRSTRAFHAYLLEQHYPNHAHG